MDRWLTLILLFFSVCGRFDVLAYEVCEHITSTLYTYCEDGKYCCHNRKDCCNYTHFAGWAVGVVIGVICIIISIVTYCLVRRRRLRMMAAARSPVQVQGVSNPSMFVVSSQTSQAQAMAPPSYNQAVNNQPPQYYN